MTRLQELQARVGEATPPGDWVEVSQEMIDRFAELTGDRQWIHVDRDRAQRESPFGATVAHGLFVLALVPRLMESAGTPWLASRIGVNYGADRLRFINPVRAGSRVRAVPTLKSVEAYGESGVKVTTQVVVEVETQSRPACAVEMIGLLLD